MKLRAVACTLRCFPLLVVHVVPATGCMGGLAARGSNTRFPHLCLVGQILRSLLFFPLYPQELAAAMGRDSEEVAAELAQQAQQALREAQESMGEEATALQALAKFDKSAADTPAEADAAGPGPGPAAAAQARPGARVGRGAPRGAGSDAEEPQQPGGPPPSRPGARSGRAAPGKAGDASAPALPAVAPPAARPGARGRSVPGRAGSAGAAQPAAAPLSRPSGGGARGGRGAPTKAGDADVASYLSSGGSEAPAVALLGVFAAAADTLGPLLKVGQPWVTVLQLPRHPQSGIGVHAMQGTDCAWGTRNSMIALELKCVSAPHSRALPPPQGVPWL
jgi:hypothetical protein